MTDRAFLRARDLADPAKAVRKRDELLFDWSAIKVRTALGTMFRHDARATLRRPWWMPGWLYRRLLASIVVEYRSAERVRP